MWQPPLTASFYSVTRVSIHTGTCTHTVHPVNPSFTVSASQMQSRTRWLVKRALKGATGWLCVLTLSYSEQVAEVSDGRLGGWRLKALNLTQN